MRLIIRGSYLGIYFLVLLLVAGCSKSKEVNTSFEEVQPAESGLLFANNIAENDSLNYFKFPYIYNGGGAGIADINNDGLSDIFLTGNMVANKLYLNKGNLQFEDISESGNIAGDGRWYTGVTVTDINNDGWVDFYLSVSGQYNTKNQLYINNGDLTFTESAAAYGIDDKSNSIQSTFFDYDNDGDLDLFVANYPLVGLSLGNQLYHEKMKERKPEESGHLYRNEGGKKFVDVTEEAGVLNFGLTLGLIASDFNNDGWVDLYLSNDFNVPDYFYINQGNGTFKEVVKEATGHTSMFGMGIDASDFNNDGLVDLIQADMTPEDYVRARVNMASMSPRNFYEAVALGFHYQYMQNSLQVNGGVNTDNIPVMSEISRMSKMASTDWSWSTLFADLDNDGWKDIYITNGMKRDVNDNDINNRTNTTSFQQAFNIKITDYASQPIANYAYRNRGDYTFEKIGKEWGVDIRGFSNGMATGDLDNDGDLDLVINNIDQTVTLFENKTEGKHFIKVSLEGPEQNLLGLGAKVFINSEQGLQKQEMTLTRGFQSSVDPILHFGLGSTTQVASIEVVWPDGKKQIIENPPIDKVIKLIHADANRSDKGLGMKKQKPFRDVTEYSGIEFTHSEDLFDDYTYEPLLPYEYSKMGPGLAKGDVNNDGLEDFFIGNAAGKPGVLFVQNNESKFQKVEGPWSKDAMQEDAGAIFADFDGDGDQDLYVVSHGNQFQDIRDRLYINTPSGFVKTTAAIPEGAVAGKAIAVGDFDGDGLLDIFLGGRNVPAKYPYPTSSLLLKNSGGVDGNLRFENATEKLASELIDMGMVTDAEWVDIDKDGWLDLILSGEWMPITIFKNEKGTMVNRTDEFGLAQAKGWWYTVKSVDVDNDGDLDLVAGNLGLNHKYQASDQSPFEVYSTDFDENGKNDIVFSYKKGEKEVPLRGRECSAQQVPAIGKRFETYRSFASADLNEIYGASVLRGALHYEANTFGNTWFENENGKFIKQHVLPGRSQFSSINKIEVIDYNNDEYKDLLMVGNLYAAEVETPRVDSGLGIILTGSANGFQEVTPAESGLLFRGDVKNLISIQLANGKTGYLMGSNNSTLKLMELK